VPSPPDEERTRRQLRRFRIRVFIATWLSYAGLYFCRKPFYIVKATLTEELGIGASALADIGTVYLVAYTLGQFVAAGLGSVVGARRMLLGGMAVSVVCNVIFGGAASYWVLLVFSGFNGLAQGTGWSGNVGTMAHWTTRRERGTIMGFWSTCYQVGGVMANGLAALLLGWRGWRWSFFGGSAVLGGVILQFWRLQRNRPEDVGLPPLRELEDNDREGAARAGGGLRRLGWDRQVVITLLLVGGFYFCVKFIRYSLWSWAPYFMQLTFGLEGDDAGYLSTIFDVAGFFGAVTAGVVSDRVFRGRRSIVAFIMLAGMTAGCLLLWGPGSGSVTYFAVGLAVVGFMLYGPDSLMTAAGAIDLGSRRGAIAAAGVINGMGSVGSVVQEKVVANLYQRSGGELAPVFLVLLSAAAASMLLIGIVLWRNRTGRSDL
jgi:OPA family glycerol-3-phosphate transporter-like MFS transporter